MLTCFYEIICELQLQPCFRRAAKGLRQSNGHVWADTGLCVDDVVQRLTGNAKHLCTGRN